MPAQLSQTSHSSSNIGWTDSGWYIQSPSKKVLCMGSFYEIEFKIWADFIEVEVLSFWVHTFYNYFE